MDTPAAPSVTLCEINDLACHHLQCARDYAISHPSVCAFVDMAMLELRRQIPDLEPRPRLRPVPTGKSIPVRGGTVRRLHPVK